MGPAKFINEGMWIIPLVMMLICFFLFKSGMFKNKGFKRNWKFPASDDNQTKTEERPLDILKKRYARGEISKEEFHNMKNELES